MQQVDREAARALLKKRFGYHRFRLNQEAIISSLLAGRDVLALMPTGGGKSLCFQIPALLRPGVGVVISPLIALMQDQVDALNQIGIRAAFLNSTQRHEVRRATEQALTKGVLDLLYLAPERLLNPTTLELLDSLSLALFAIDEAHCVSQWGHDFRPEYRQLSLLPRRYPGVPRIALTATADRATRVEIIDQLDLQQADHYISSFDRPNIRYLINDGQNARAGLWRFIQNEHPTDAGIVYCLSRKKVESTAQWLCSKGRIALPYHAGLPTEVRAAHQARFLREEGVIIVATIAFGMGIDKPDVRFVAHLNLPRSIEAYYQETGRSGRDGLPADAWLAYGLQDVITLRQMTQASDADESYKRVLNHKLEAMLGLCELSSCRRQTLLAYFGETLAQPCGNCDNCLQPPQSWDATEAARMALSCVYRTGQRFGVNYVIDVLTGKQQDERIRRNGHQKLSTYGIGKCHSVSEWRGIFRQLIARGYLTVDIDGHGALRLSESCRPLLRGEVRLELRRSVRSEQPKRDRKLRGSMLREQDRALFEALRSLRRQLAEEHDVPPYVIFHDNTLEQMARLRPGSERELLEIPGIGERKLQQYGQGILQLIARHPLPELLDNNLSDTVNATLTLHLEGLDAETIARRRELSLATVHGHFASAIAQGVLDLRDVITLPAEAFQRIAAALELLADSSEGRLKAVYEALDEQFDYGILKCVQAALGRSPNP